MTSARLLGLGLVTALTLAALGACGSDDGGAAVDPNNEGGLPGEGGVLPDGFVPPVRAEFGLDSRPANPTCKAPARPPSTAPIKLEEVFSNVTLGLPMQIAQIPGDKTRWFVAQRGGNIVKFNVNSPANAPVPVGNLPTVSGCTINQAGEGGFLGMAFHPKFATNGKLYVSWTVNDGQCGAATGSPVGMQSTIGVLHSPDNGDSFDTYTTIVPPFPQPATNHNGGGIAFGKDGLLYFSFGDGGGGDDPFIHGQSTATMFSKILRVDVDNPGGGNAYGIPATNPFRTGAGGAEPATFAYGFRNPFRFSIDRETNEVWTADVGQNKYEEIDGKVKNGANYGWPCREGLHDYITTAPKCPSNTGSTDPLAEHEHIPNNSRSITGGFVYRGTAIPALIGSYIYGDYKTKEIWTLSLDPSTGEAKTTQVATAPAEDWVSFAEDNDGEVYAVSLGNSNIYKVVAEGPQGANTFPDRLSKTGCVDPKDAKKPLPALIPYGVNAALWSDGALKERWLAIPDGKTIAVKDADGDFDLPAGSVLVKTFSLAGKRIETRLFMRHDDGGWAGYTYEWLDDQSDAVLLPAGKIKTVGTQTWTFPSRSDCVSCHTEAAGRSLGLELSQLNAEYTYPSTNRLSNQLKTLDKIGMFDKPLGKPVDQILAYPDPYGTAGTAETRARAYLHSNCSNCHRPQGGGRGEMDLRWGTPFAMTKSCNVDPEAGDIGVAGAKLIVPGKPELSLVSLRPHSPAANRMPPIASTVVDTQGVKVIDDFIKGITACP